MGAHALVQIRDAAARANAGAWLRPRTHPGSLSEHNARNAPCRQPAVWPGQRRTAGPDRSHRLRSVRNATRWPGATGQGQGSTQGRTQAVSASTTRLARSRQCALRSGAQQGQLVLTACDRHRTRRVGRTMRSGVGLSYWAIARGGDPPPRAHTCCTGCTCALGYGVTHGTVSRTCWGQRTKSEMLHCPWSP